MKYFLRGMHQRKQNMEVYRFLKSQVMAFGNCYDNGITIKWYLQILRHHFTNLIDQFDLTSCTATKNKMIIITKYDETILR